MKIAGTSGSTSLAVSRGQLGTTAATYSSGVAVSDIHDWLYMSVTTGGTQTGTSCSGTTTACLYSFDATAPLTTTSTAAAGLAAPGGTSGTIIDNMSTTFSGASQVYFSTLINGTCATSGTNGGCAVQASQSTLSQ